MSAALFGSVFLSVVASTTALVRHNADPAAWPAGIAAFTIVFAFGQIVGPALVGWVADGPGGLVAGFACSAAALALGALLAWRQQAAGAHAPLSLSAARESCSMRASSSSSACRKAASRGGLPAT